MADSLISWVRKSRYPSNGAGSPCQVDPRWLEAGSFYSFPHPLLCSCALPQTTLTRSCPKAAEAGVKLRSLLRPDDTLHFFTSPYRRTRETTEGILNALTADNPDPSPFPRNTIKVYEEPRLREQDFGNFQPGSGEMARMWQERADYGHFFYRIPNGESAADAYDRISGFNESLWRSFVEEDFASVCVLVTHGLMTRVFLMKWYHFSVEYFEDLRNVNHCEFVVMKLNADNGKFILQNQLRTWSQLKREEVQAVAPPASPIPVRKRWGDWQDSFDAGGFDRRQHQRRQNTADLFRDEGAALAIEHAIRTHSSKQPTNPGLSGTHDDSRGRAEALSEEPKPDVAGRIRVLPAGTRQRTLSPTTQKILNAGRDGGGSKSGAASEEEDDDDDEGVDASPSKLHESNHLDGASPRPGPTQPKEKGIVRQREKTSRGKPANPKPQTAFPGPGMNSMALALQGGLGRGRGLGLDGTVSTDESGGSPNRARADALGDQSDVEDG